MEEQQTPLQTSDRDAAIPASQMPQGPAPAEPAQAEAPVQVEAPVQAEAPAPPAQPVQPAYGYGQPVPPQYSYTQPAAPQYGYTQPAAPRQGYGWPTPPYGYAQPVYQPVQPLGQSQAPRRAVASMVLMMIAITFLSAAVAYFLPQMLDSPFFRLGYYRYRPYGYGYGYRYYDNFVYYSFQAVQIPTIIGTLSVLASAVLMLIGAIRGSRGSTLFGVGILVLSLFALGAHLAFAIEADFVSESTLLLIGSLLMVSAIVLSGVACLIRNKGMRIAGGILLLVVMAGMAIIYLGALGSYSRRDSDTGIALNIFGLIGGILLSVAVICFPLRKTGK